MTSIPNELTRVANTTDIDDTITAPAVTRSISSAKTLDSEGSISTAKTWDSKIPSQFFSTVNAIEDYGEFEKNLVNRTNESNRYFPNASKLYDNYEAIRSVGSFERTENTRVDSQTLDLSSRYSAAENLSFFKNQSYAQQSTTYDSSFSNSNLSTSRAPNTDNSINFYENWKYDPYEAASQFLRYNRHHRQQYSYNIDDNYMVPQSLPLSGSSKSATIVDGTTLTSVSPSSKFYPNQSSFGSLDQNHFQKLIQSTLPLSTVFIQSTINENVVTDDTGKDPNANTGFDYSNEKNRNVSSVSRLDSTISSNFRAEDPLRLDGFSNITSTRQDCTNRSIRYNDTIDRDRTSLRKTLNNSAIFDNGDNDVNVAECNVEESIDFDNFSVPTPILTNLLNVVQTRDSTDDTKNYKTTNARSIERTGMSMDTIKETVSTTSSSSGLLPFSSSFASLSSSSSSSVRATVNSCKDTTIANESFVNLCKRLNYAAKIKSLAHCKRLLRDELNTDGTPSSMTTTTTTTTYHRRLRGNVEKLLAIERIRRFKFQIINPRMNPDTYRIGAYKFMIMIREVFSKKILDGIDDKCIKRDLSFVDIIAERVRETSIGRRSANKTRAAKLQNESHDSPIRILDVYDFLKSFRFGSFGQKKNLFARFTQKLSAVELKWLFLLILRRSPFQSYRVNVLSLTRAKSYVLHEWLTSYFYKPLRRLISIEDKFARSKQFFISLRLIGLRQFQIHYTNKNVGFVESARGCSDYFDVGENVEFDNSEDDMFTESMKSQYIHTLYGEVLENIDMMRKSFKFSRFCKISLFSMQRCRVQNLPLYCDVVLKKLFEPLSRVVVSVDFIICNNYHEYRSNEIMTRSAVYLTNERRRNRFTLNFGMDGFNVVTKNFPIFKLLGVNKNNREFVDRNSKVFLFIQDCLILERKDLRDVSLRKRLRAFYDVLSSGWIKKKDSLDSDSGVNNYENIATTYETRNNIDGDDDDDDDDGGGDDDDDDDDGGDDDEDSSEINDEDYEQENEDDEDNRIVDFSHSADDLLNRAATFELVLFDSPSCIVVLCDWYNSICKYEQLVRLANIVNFDRFYFSLRSANDKISRGNFWNVRPIVADRTSSFLIILGGWKNNDSGCRGTLSRILVGCRRSRSVPLVDPHSWCVGEWLPCGVVANGLNKRYRDEIDPLVVPFSNKIWNLFADGDGSVRPDYMMRQPLAFAVTQCERIIDSVKYNSKVTFKLPKVLQVMIADDGTLQDFVECCDDLDSLSEKKMPISLN